MADDWITPPASHPQAADDWVQTTPDHPTEEHVGGLERYGREALGALESGTGHVLSAFNPFYSEKEGQEREALRQAASKELGFSLPNIPSAAEAGSELQKAGAETGNVGKAQHWYETAGDIPSQVAGGFAPGLVQFAGRVPMAVESGIQTAKEQAAAENRPATWDDYVGDVMAEATGRKLMDVIGSSGLSKVKQALGFGAVTGAQEAAEGKGGKEAGKAALINAAIGLIPGGHAQEAETPPARTDAALPEAPQAAPVVGDTIGLKFPKGPSKRGQVEAVFDDGRSARVRFDDGTAGDYTMQDIVRDMVEPPPVMQAEQLGKPEAGRTEQTEDDWINDFINPPESSPRPPGPTPLLNDVDENLRRADRLTRIANDPTSKMTDEDRVGFKREAADIRQQFGHDSNPQVDPRSAAEKQQDQQAAQERLALEASPQILGQHVPAINNAPQNFSPEELQRGAQPPVPAAQPGETNILGQNVPLVQSDQMTPSQAPTEPVRPVQPPPAPPAHIEPSAGPYAMVRPDQLNLDPKRFQYKESDEQGVTGALKGVTRWEPALANPITAWQDKDGNLFVVNGHQRTDLAKRAQAAGQDVQMPARIYREADGWTPEQMKVLGAYQNIAEGTGTSVDAAKVLRGKNALPDNVRLPELPPRSQLYQDANGLASLSNESFGAVVNGVIPPEYAAQVGHLLKDPTEQMAAIDAIAKAQPANSNQARLMVEDIRNSGFMRGEQTTLFGDEAFAQSLFGERAKILDDAMRKLRSLKGTFKTAVEQEGTLTGAGNVMSREANEAAQNANAALIERLKQDGTRRGPISDALSDAARSLQAGKPITAVTSQFLGAVRRIRPEAEAVPGSDHVGGSESEESPLGPGLFARTERTDQGEQYVLPGAERSAQQAAAARGDQRMTSGRAQKAMDVGMFGERPQQDMFTKPAAPAEWREPGLGKSDPKPAELPWNGYGRDMTAELQRYRAQKPYANDTLGNARAMAHYVVERGGDHGHEFMAIQDADDPSFMAAGTLHRDSATQMPSSVNADMMDPDRNLVIHHNHTNDIPPLSTPDIMANSAPGLKAIIAHTPEGHMFGAALADELRDHMRDMKPSERAAFLQPIITAAKNGANDPIARALLNGLPQEDANLALTQAITDSLAAAGVLTHVTNSINEYAPWPYVRNAMQAGAEAVQAALAKKGIDLGGPERIADYVSNYRTSGSTSYADAITKLLGQTPTGTAESAARPANQGSTAGSAARPGARAPNAAGVQQRLPGFESRAEDADTGVPGHLAASAEQVATIPEAQRLPPEEKDPVDDVTNQIAANATEGGSAAGRTMGTYFRSASRALKPNPQLRLSLLDNMAIFPRTFAELDKRFGQLYGAVRAQTETANRYRHTYSEMQRSLNDLSPADRENVYAAEELIRLQNRVIPDDGRQLIVRNENTPQAQKSQPGQTIALSPEATQAFHDSRAMFSQIWDDRAAAAAKNLGWTGGTDPQAAYDAAAQAMDRGERRRLVQAGDLLQSLQDQKREAYVPFQRFGDYYITAKPKPGTAAAESLGWGGNGFPPTGWFQLVDSSAPWEKLFGAREQMGQVPEKARTAIEAVRAKFPEADGWELEHGHLARNVDMLRSIDIPTMDKFLTALGQKDDKLWGPIVEELKDKMYEELKSGFTKPARDIPGYDEDFGRSRGTYIGWVSRNIAEMQHREDVENKKTLMQGHPQDLARRYANDWMSYIQSPRYEMNTLRQAGFYWQLALNPSSTLLVMTHGPMVAHAVLSASGGIGSSGAHLYPAFAEALRNIKFDTQSGFHVALDNLGRTPEERAMIADAVARGQMHSSAADDLRGLTSGAMETIGSNRSGWQRMLDVAASNIAVADQVNRAGVLLGTYRLMQKAGQLEKFDKVWGNNQNFADLKAREGLTPQSVAKFMIDEGLFVWGAQNKARMARGPGSVLFQFRNFEMNYLSTLYKMMGRMGPEGQKAGLFMLAGLTAMGGMLAAPFTQDIENAFDWGYKHITGIDPMADAKIRQLMEDGGFSQVGADLMLHGPSRAAGFDLSSRLGFGDVISRTGENPWEMVGVFPAMMAGRVSSAATKMAHGQMAEGMADLLPTAARNVVRGAAMGEHGVNTQYGNAVVPADQVGKGAQVAQSLGFEPTSVARAYEERQYEQRLQKSQDELKSRLTSQAIDLETQLYHARQSGDQAQTDRLTNQIRSIYRDHPDVRINVQTVNRGVSQRVNPGAYIQAQRAKSLKGQESPYPGAQ